MSHERTALIDGVRLTRAQLEAGLKQLEESKWCRVMHRAGSLAFADENGDPLFIILRNRGDFAGRAVSLPACDHYEYQIIPDPHIPSLMLLVCRPKQGPNERHDTGTGRGAMTFRDQAALLDTEAPTPLHSSHGDSE